MNRSARRLTLFDDAHDYGAFVRILGEAEAHRPMRLLCFVVMPNHWHLVLWPEGDEDLSGYLRWVTGTHAVRWHRAHGSSGTGAVYQGRFKAVPVQADGHFLSVCRYIEQNPVRARLVDRATQWQWSSAACVRGEGWPTLHRWPIPRPDSWEAATPPAAAAGPDIDVRHSVRSGRPFGTPEWSIATAQTLGLSLRERGRPPGGPRTGGPRPRAGRDRRI